MKKKRAILLLGVMMVTLLLVGYGQAAQAPTESETPAQTSESALTEEAATPPENEIRLRSLSSCFSRL